MNPNAKPIVDQVKARKLAKAERFAADMKAISAPKKTVLLSIMASYGFRVREARAIYRDAKGV